jgi:hypothetical protein
MSWISEMFIVNPIQRVVKVHCLDDLELSSEYCTLKQASTLKYYLHYDYLEFDHALNTLLASAPLALR